MLTTRLRRMRGFTLIELMIVVAIIGILAAVAIPAFMKYIRRAKTTEASMNVRKMYDATVAYYLSEFADQNGNIQARTFPPAAAATPGMNACCAQTGQKCAPNPTAWQTPTWQALNFSVDDPHYYWYSTTRAVGTGTAVGDRYDLTANGNLNCDANYSTFQRAATVDAQFSIRGGSGLYVVSDIE